MQNQYVKLNADSKELQGCGDVHAITLVPAANLMFAAQPLTNADGHNRLDFEDAENACKECRIGGFDDWRLPTVKELFGVVDHGKYNPAIDTDAFPDTESTWHWTSTPDASAPEDYAWLVSFNGGYVNFSSRNYTACVRAVRSVSPPSQ